jgi:hypothetical protein
MSDLSENDRHWKTPCGNCDDGNLIALRSYIQIAAKSEVCGAFCPQPVTAIAARIKDCAMSRSQKNNAECAAKKAALWVCWGFLSHRRFGHVAQTISELFHHVRRELRVLLNEKMEPPLIDRRQSAGGLRHSVGSTRTVIEQRDHADQPAYPAVSTT